MLFRSVSQSRYKLEEGMKFLVKSIKSYTDLINFFKYGGLDPWGEKTKQYFTILSPVEQYLVQKKKRLFKGIDDYSSGSAPFRKFSITS